MNKKLVAVRRPESQGIEPYRDNTLAVLAAENEALKAELESTRRKQQAYTALFTKAKKFVSLAAAVVWAALVSSYLGLLGVELVVRFLFYTFGKTPVPMDPAVVLFILAMSAIHMVLYGLRVFSDQKGKSND